VRADGSISPEQLLARARSSLDRATSFRFWGGEEGIGGDQQTFSGEVVMPGRLRLTASHLGRRYSLIVVGANAFIKANPRYWLGLGVPAARVGAVAGHWVREPASAMPASVRVFASRTLAGRCMIGLTDSTASIVTHRMYDGIRTTILQVKDRHGPLTTALVRVSSDARSLPLTVSQAGPDDPPDPACGGSPLAGNVVHSAGVAFSAYGKPFRISAPAGTLTVGAVHRRLTTPGWQPEPHPGQHLSLEQRQAAQLQGVWLATGTISKSHNYSAPDERVGTSFRRLWAFRSGCVHRVCQVTMVRSTNAGRLIAGLSWSHGVWRASFQNTTICADGSQHPDSDQMILSLTGSGLTAVERQRSTDSCGPAASAVAVWHAQRELRAPGSNAST
jgi:hypothetical protein